MAWWLALVANSRFWRLGLHYKGAVGQSRFDGASINSDTPITFLLPSPWVVLFAAVLLLRHSVVAWFPWHS